jgi:hypothetical protein
MSHNFLPVLELVFERVGILCNFFSCCDFMLRSSCSGIHVKIFLSGVADLGAYS